MRSRQIVAGLVGLGVLIYTAAFILLETLFYRTQSQREKRLINRCRGLRPIEARLSVAPDCRTFGVGDRLSLWRPRRYPHRRKSPGLNLI